jgi:hypothetical protein
MLNRITHNNTELCSLNTSNKEDHITLFYSKLTGQQFIQDFHNMWHMYSLTTFECCDFTDFLVQCLLWKVDSQPCSWKPTTGPCPEPVYTFTHCFSKIHFNIILHCMPTQLSLYMENYNFYGLDSLNLILSRDRDFTLCHHAQIGSGANPTSCWKNTRGFFPWG